MRSGNVERDNPQERYGWFFGQFVEPDSPFHNEQFELKWGRHKAGETKKTPTYNRKAATINLLISGSCEYDLDGGKTLKLDQPGDWLLLEPGEGHGWRALTDCLLIIVRWPSLEGDQVERPLHPGSS